MLKRSLLLVTIFIWWSALASAQNVVHTFYGTAPSDGKILRIDATFNASGVFQSSTVTLVEKLTGPSSSPTDIAFGPDGNLYVIVNRDRIIRMTPTGGNQTTFFTTTPAVGTLGTMRFRIGSGSVIALYLTTSKGLFRFNNFQNAASLVQLVTRTLDPEAAGVSVEVTGRLVGVDGANLFRVSRDAANEFTSAGNLNLQGFFDRAVGVAVEAPSSKKCVTGTLPGGASDAVACFTCANGSCSSSESATLVAGDLARDIEFSLSGFAAFATTNGDGNGGKFWLWRPGESPVLVADLKLETGQTKAKSAFGVAWPPDERVAEEVTTDGPTKRFNCGHSFVDVPAEASTVDLTCRLELPASVNAQFTGAADGLLCTVYDWAPFCTLMDVTLGGVAGDAAIGIAYGRDSEAFTPFRPELVRNFNQVSIFDYHLVGVLDPEDQTRIGKGTSILTLADAGAQGATFQGFFPNNVSLDRSTAPITQGNELPIRVAFDPPVDPDTGVPYTLRLSPARIEDEFGDPVLDFFEATSSGNANELNFFRFDPGGSRYIYNWSLTGLPKGLYVLSIWGDAGVVVQGFVRLQ